MNAGEWGSASSFVFPAGEAEGRVWAMHDGDYVYFAFRRIDTAPGTSAAFQVYFDNAHDGALDPGDDAWSAAVNVSTGASFTNDAAYTPASCPIVLARRHLALRDERHGSRRGLHTRHRRGRLRGAPSALHDRCRTRSLPPG